MVPRNPQIDRQIASATAAAAKKSPMNEEKIAASAEAAEKAQTVAATPTDPVDPAELEPKVVAALRSVFDPEIPVNIYEMGLIYNVDIAENGKVDIQMTLTSPACPVAGTLPGEVETAVETVDGVSSAEVEIVWDPSWNPSMMSEAARLELGMM